MRKPKFPSALSFIAPGLLVMAVPAYGALPGITFVSATGTNVSTYSCSKIHPCATFQYAISQTIDGGEVDALSGGELTGGQGITISGSITIDGKGIASVNVPVNYDAISINSGPTDTVVLRGLSINGQASPEVQGAIMGVYYTGGNLDVENCIITGFQYEGIEDATTGGTVFHVKNTTINGGEVGIYLNEGGGSTTLDHVTITGTIDAGVFAGTTPGSLVMNDSLIVGGNYGVEIYNTASSSTASFITLLERVTINGTTNTGLYVGVGSAGVDSSTFFGNELAMATNGGSLRISNNNMYSNTYGIECGGGSIQTDSNNRHGGPTGIATYGSCPAVAPVYVE